MLVYIPLPDEIGALRMSHYKSSMMIPSLFALAASATTSQPESAICMVQPY